MPEQQKRQVACKARISELLEGDYIKEEGWNPNFISTKNGKTISRVNLIATVISLNDNGNQQSAIVDDGSGSISLRTFEKNEVLNSLGVGDVVLVVGRPREYGSEKYVMPEITKKIEDKRWIDVRRIELEIEEKSRSREENNDKTKKGKEMYTVEEIDEKQKYSVGEIGKKHETVYETVRNLDKGDGADIEDVIKESGVKEAEEIIKRFMMEGEMFEIRPGRIKILE